jgi:hypothetical protein
MLVNLDVKATPVTDGNGASDPAKNKPAASTGEALKGAPTEPKAQPAGEAMDDEEIVIGDEGETEDDAEKPEADNDGDGDGNDEDESGDEGSDESDEPEHRRLSRNQRKNLKIRALSESISAKDERIRELESELARRTSAGRSEDEDLVEPKEADFPNNYLAFENAMREYRIRKVIREEAARTAGERTKEVAEELRRIRVAAYNERLAQIRDRIPDFDETLERAKNVPIRDDVCDRILESAKGPQIAHYLARNLDKVAELNRMTPLAAAREIGRLEARIRGPQPKKTTEAPAPLTRPRGSGTRGAPKRIEDMSMEEYTRAREQGLI